MNLTRRYYFILALLVLLFVAPGVLAYLFYLHPHWMTSGTTNKGQFVQPSIVAHSRPALSSKWQLILWEPRECGTSCIRHLEQLNRIHVALGRRFYEVDVVLMLGVESPVLSEIQVNSLKQNHIRVVRPSKNQSNLLLQYEQPTFFIANPNHALILQFPISAQSDDLFHDLKWLLTQGASNR